MANETQTLAFADPGKLKQELSMADPQAIQADPSADPELAKRAEDEVSRIFNVQINDPAAQDQVKATVEVMGAQLQTEAARQSQMLKQPVATLYRRAEDGGEVANALIDLKIQVEDLDPARYDLEAGWLSRTLGYLPGIGTPLKRYFSRYESASTVMDAIIRSLKAGQEQLKRDNITLTADQRAMRELTLKLEKAVKLGQLIDARLMDRLQTEVLESDPKYKFLQEEIQFPLRQRIQDLQQQLLVAQQGVLTIEMIIRNNKELIRGVTRALSVTISALQVAVTLALALANQRIVLEKIQAISETTNNLIAGTAERLRTQGAEIHKQASGTQLSMETLKRAFTDVRAALGDISRYRQEALPRMAQQITDMDRMSAEAEQTIRNMEHSERARVDFPIEIVD
jgi:uncharacterized protein YaaN involved in tellurite resistance